MALQWVYIARLSWPPQSSLRLRAACFPPPAPMQSPDGQTEQGLAYIPNDNFCSGWLLLAIGSRQVFTLLVAQGAGSSLKQCCCGARTDGRVRYAETARCALGL